MHALLLRQWLKRHPELAIQFEIGNDDSVLVLVYNPDKTKILAKFNLPPQRQELLLTRLEECFL